MLEGLECLCPDSPVLAQRLLCLPDSDTAERFGAKQSEEKTAQPKITQAAAEV